MTETIALIKGRPYATCTQCGGTGDDGNPPFCDNCFGSGMAPLDLRSAALLSAQAELGDQAAPTVRQRLAAGNGRTSGVISFANKYPGKCARCGGWVEAEKGIRVREAQGWAVQHITNGCPPVQQQMQVTAPAPAHKPNQYPGHCRKCEGWVKAGEGILVGTKGSYGVEHATCPASKPEPTDDGLDLSPLPAGLYAVPDGDTRLKVEIDRPEGGKWDGWIFVKDGAVYGDGQRYGTQRPGQKYRGKIEDALRAILADPKAAMAAYGHLTGTCGRCHRPLEDAASVARGIGPVCLQKLGW